MVYVMNDLQIERWNVPIPMKLITKTESIDIKTPVQRVLQMLDKYPAIIVNKNNGYYGVIDSRSIHRARGALNVSKNQSIERYTEHITPITSKTNMNEVLMQFMKTHSKAIPFLLNKRVVGVFDRSTMLKIMLSLRMLDDIQVKDIMNSPIIAIDSSSTLAQAKNVMENNRINRVVVIKDKKLYGMLTYFRLIKNYSRINERLPERKTEAYNQNDVLVADVAEKSPKIVSLEKNLSYAVRQLIEQDISSLIVTNNRNMPVGIISATDIIDNMVARRRIEENRIFISGLDSNTKEYEEEIMEEIKFFISKVEDMKGDHVEYANVHIRKIKQKMYDIQVRMGLQNGRVISSHITDFILERTLKEALDILKKNIIKDKERYITIKKIGDTSKE